MSEKDKSSIKGPHFSHTIFIKKVALRVIYLTPDLTNPVCGCLPPAALVKFSDEATETVARDKLLAVQLEARLGRGVVVLEPLFDGAAYASHGFTQDAQRLHSCCVAVAACLAGVQRASDFRVALSEGARCCFVTVRLREAS